MDLAPPERHGLVAMGWKPEDDMDRVEGVKHRAMKRLAETQAKKEEDEKNGIDPKAGKVRGKNLTAAVVDERLALIKEKKRRG